MMEEKDGAVQVTWDLNKEPDIESYKIYRALFDENSIYEEVGSALSTVNSYLDKGLMNKRTYSYYVRAGIKGGYLSPKSDPIIAIPGEFMAVENLKAEQGKNNIILSWDRLPGKSIGGYAVYRAMKKKEKPKKLKKVLDNKFVDNEVKQGETYYYSVQTIGKNNEDGNTTKVLEVLY